jgi:hypothetical protein
VSKTADSATSQDRARTASRSRATERALAKQAKTLSRFIAVYCERQHGSPRGELCVECAGLRDYALRRLSRCPYDPKPKCKECRTHCYAPEYRARIREVMRFSGTHFVRRGRLDWLVRYFLSEGLPRAGGR